jgi:hypothetical protein
MGKPLANGRVCTSPITTRASADCGGSRHLSGLFLRSTSFVTKCVALALIMLSPASVYAYEESQGGVNLNAYCSQAFGNSFKALAVGQGAGDWVCQNGSNTGDRRAISVQTACQQQYPKYASVIKARSGAGAGSWVCVLLYREHVQSVAPYCQQRFGAGWIAVSTGPTINDWTCQDAGNVTNRRPAPPIAVCRTQVPNSSKVTSYGRDVVCLVGPVPDLQNPRGKPA